MDEWQRLPKGFRVIEHEEILKAQMIRAAFIKGAARIGARCVEFPPVGFRETFVRGIQTTGEKVYEFKDRSDRDLLLSPDSTPHLARWYLENHPDGEPAKVFFMAPVFRYRNTPKRHWVQYGVACLNQKYPAASNAHADAPLVEIGQCYLNILQNGLKVPVTLKVGSFGVSRHLLNAAGLDETASDNMLNALRRTPAEGWADVAKAYIASEQPRSAFMELMAVKFSDEQGLIAALSTSKYLDDEVKSRVQATYEFAQNFTVPTAAPFLVEFSDFHSSEMIAGYNFRLMVPGENRHYADGGCYSHYATKFSPKITSYKSIAGGLSAAFSRIAADQETRTNIVLLSRGASAELVDPLAQFLRQNGNNVYVKEQRGSMKADIKKCPEGATSLALPTVELMPTNTSRIRGERAIFR